MTEDEKAAQLAEFAKIVVNAKYAAQDFIDDAEDEELKSLCMVLWRVHTPPCLSPCSSEPPDLLDRPLIFALMFLMLMALALL